MLEKVTHIKATRKQHQCALEFGIPADWRQDVDDSPCDDPVIGKGEQAVSAALFNGPGKPVAVEYYHPECWRRKQRALPRSLASSQVVTGDYEGGKRR